MGPRNPGQATRTLAAHELAYADLANVALIDAAACASFGSMSLSWWHAEVAAGRAPQPAVRQTRCTRWRLADVRDFWIEFAERAASNTEAAVQVTLRATKASARAQAARRARAAAAEPQTGE
jgi:hypothetical protein